MITIESQLKQDFVENDYVRSQMKAKLEHCASVAQAEFAQLIMKVTRVETSTGSPKNTLIHKSIDDQSSYEGEMKLNKIERNRNIDGEIDDEDDEGNDPDWDMIAKHQPATEDVPIFLQARDIRLAAEEQFAASLDEVDSKLSKFSDEILTVAADVFNTVSKNMIVLEDQLKHGFIENEKARSLMQTKLEQSASAAQEQFTKLMMRVTQVGEFSYSNSIKPNIRYSNLFQSNVVPIYMMYIRSKPIPSWKIIVVIEVTIFENSFSGFDNEADEERNYMILFLKFDD